MRLSGGIGKDRDAHPVLPMMPGSPAGAHPQARPRAQADISSCSYKTCCSSAPITLGSPATDIPARFSTLTSMPCLTCVPGIMVQQLLVKIPAPNKMKSFKAEHPLGKRHSNSGAYVACMLLFGSWPIGLLWCMMVQTSGRPRPRRSYPSTPTGSR